MSAGLAERRVVVTGMGVVTPVGHDLESFWSAVVEGRSGAGPLTRFEAGDLPCRIACEVKDLNVGQFIDPKKAKRFERAVRYGLVAARLAVNDAGIDLAQAGPDRLAVIEGASVAGMESSFKGQLAFENKGYRSMSPFTLINSYSGCGSAEVAIELGVEGPALTVGSGSCASADAIGQARAMIVAGEVDVALAGGSEAPLLGPLFGAFCLARAMSTRNETPAEAMRPFDKGRDGFVLGEGAAYVVLEEMSGAVARGARIYAELVGYGSSCEGQHSVTPHPEGIGLSRAIRKALRQARMDSTELDYLNLHGAASETQDPAETQGVKLALGPRAGRVSASATKPVTGNALGAAGAIEAVITCLAIDREAIPPTINFKEAAPGCDLDYVPNEARPFPLRAAMSVNAGFGGRYSGLLFRRLEAR